MDNHERFPDFFIIGVPKAGTTSLVNYLNHHPEIFTPQIKEPDAFFYKQINGDFIGDADLSGKRGPMSRKQYLSIFENSRNATAIGESSFYLYSKNALHNLVNWHQTQNLF